MIGEQDRKADKPDLEQRPRLIPKYGGYRNLRSFQTAQLVYDGTVAFCNRFVDRRSRTHDQMVQAARSGVQNIAEGSVASATSKITELICLIHQATYLLRRQLENLERQFLNEGGFTKKLYRARSEARNYE